MNRRDALAGLFNDLPLITEPPNMEENEPLEWLERLVLQVVV